MSDTDYSITPITDALPPDVLDRLKDPIWRICNLYRVKDRNSKTVKFSPNIFQKRILYLLFKKGYRRLAVLKVRQLGVTTLMQVIAADMMLWTKNSDLCFIADTKENAQKILSEKLKFILNEFNINHPEFAAILESETFAKDDASTLRLKEQNTSIVATARARSGTYQFLHVSELGKMSIKDPARANEVKTGALPTVSVNAIVVYESTHEGGKFGYWYEVCEQSLKVELQYRTKLDFFFVFFPWYEHDEYETRGDCVQISDKINKYLDALELKIKLKLKPEKRLWYYKTWCSQKQDMRTEYPSYPEEAWELPSDNTIYGMQISELKLKGAICNFSHERGLPCFIVCDIGVNDVSAYWCIQPVKREILVLDFHYMGGVGMDYHAKVWQDWHIKYGVKLIILPHDAAQRSAFSCKNVQQELHDIGIKNTVILPRITDIGVGIRAVRGVLPHCVFHKDNTATDRTDANGNIIYSGMTILETYRYKYDDIRQTNSMKPLHDFSSNGADAFRYFAEAVGAGVISMNTADNKLLLDSKANFNKIRPQQQMNRVNCKINIRR